MTMKLMMLTGGGTEGKGHIQRDMRGNVVMLRFWPSLLCLNEFVAGRNDDVAHDDDVHDANDNDVTDRLSAVDCLHFPPLKTELETFQGLILCVPSRFATRCVA